MIRKISASILACCAMVAVGDVVKYPSLQKPGVSKLSQQKTNATLSNSLISAKWDYKDGKIKAPVFKNILTGEVLASGGELFALALEKQVVDDSWVYVGIAIEGENATTMISSDGKNWQKLNIVKISKDAKPSLLRVGKTDKKGSDKDYGSLGEMGSSEFLEVQESNKHGQINVLTGKPARFHKSKSTGTEIAINNERGTINAAANAAAFSEYKLDEDSKFFSCRIKKGTDKGMTWAPGMTLVTTTGEFIVVGVRSKNNYNVLSQNGEAIVPMRANAGLNCDLSSNDFKLDSCKTIENKEKGINTVIFMLKDTKDLGLTVKMEAELRNGSNYIRQNFTITGTKKLEIHGLQLLDFKVKDAKQCGTVPGSPVTTQSFFTGVEMPVTSNFISPDGYRSGFGCYLPVDKDVKYEFGTVVGVYPKGQLRRAFNFYLERERAMKSTQFLHYNNWYDFYPSEKAFNRVIEDYGRELTQKRGIKLDSFVMDDGWDNFREGLWTFNRKNFPEGFKNVAANSQKINSNLGVWISPLGGYGGCGERTAHARDMGIIKDKLDLSQPGYYKWYRDKCLELINNYNVNYFKWDKAGSGVDPHFMALVRIAKELKQIKPDLYLNVTVGTWPSPFWLNHIDCTWRDGSGDVNWFGPGDKRESWLTYRDMYCYRLCVKPAPLYPINSLMHHGLVLGYHYQAKAVSTAGAKFKNAARSYFGMGPNLQELYLTPALMTQEAWDDVADAIKWGKANKDVLVDAHWIGGDPGKLEVYGTAAWLDEKGTIMIRNPNDKAQTITLEIGEVFELPEGAAKTWILKNSYADQKYKAPTMKVGEKVTFTLQPFEVLVFDAVAK